MASDEELLISSVLQTADASIPMQWGLSEEHMHSFDDEWAWILGFVMKHGKVPSKGAFARQWPSFTF